MASPFQRYQSGIEASTGNLVSAYGQMAQQTSASFANLGNTLAEGIKTYAKNEQENQLLTAKAQGLAGNFEFLTKQIKENPELAPFAESFDPILKKIGGFETMSKAQKQALLLEAEAFQANIAPALTIFKEGNVSRTRQGVESALNAKPQIKTTSGVTIQALPFQPDKTPEWNIQNNREYIELTKKNNPKLSGLDTESALHQIADGWSTAFASDPNLAKSDPKFRDTILKGLSDWKNLAGNVATDESGVTDYAKEAEAYAGATTSAVSSRLSEVAAEKLAADKAAGKTTTVPAGVKKQVTAKEAADAGDKAIALEKDIRALFGTRKELAPHEQKRKDEMLANIKSLKETAASSGGTYEEAKAAQSLTEEDKFKSVVSAKTDSYEKRYLEELLADVKSGGYVGIMDRLAQHTMGNERLYNEVIRDPAVAGKASPEVTQEALSVTDQRRQELVDWIGKLRDTQGLGVTGDGSDIRPAKKLAVTKMIEERIAAIDKRISKPAVVKPTTTAEARVKAEEIASGTTSEASKVAKPSYAETLARPFDFNTRIQTDVPTERDMTYAEEKQYVRKWFIENRGGVIPESLDAVYRSIRPETDVQFMPAPDGGQVMITSKGAQYIAPVKPEKAMTDKERSEIGLYNYGVRDPSGTRIIATERTKGSGIRLSGFATGGEKNAEAFQKLHDDTVKVRTIIPKLLAMYEKDKIGRTLIPNEMWGDAESLIAQLKAAIRVETVGTGPVALPEHQMILERIGDPRKFLALDITGKSKLNSIMTSMETALKTNNAGINVIIDPPASEKSGIIRNAKIKANTQNR